MLTTSIKEASQHLHDCLERRTVMSVFSNQAHIDKHDYQLALVGLYGAIQPLEKYCAEHHFDELPPYVDAHHTVLLEDINILTSDLPEANDFYGQTRSLEKRLAAQYILEGSSLGAKVISSNLDRYNKNLPKMYFIQLAKNTKNRWDSFCHTVNALESINEAVVIKHVLDIYHILIQRLSRG